MKTSALLGLSAFTLVARLVACIVVVLFSYSSATLLTTTDVENLYNFYYASNGPEWIIFDPYRSWNFTSYNTTGTEPCAYEDENGHVVLGWEGIACSNYCMNENSCNLTSISLYERGMVGTIPSSVGDFQHLTRLHLSSNSLVGPLPESLGQSPILESVEIADNELTGSIPANLFCSTSLVALILSRNAMGSSLPTCLDASYYGQFTTLQLNSNSFTGTIPSSLFVAGLVNLDLSWNSLNGSIPSAIGLSTDLIDIKLYRNEFSHTVPTELGLILGLTALDFSGNVLTGALPSVVCSCRSLFSINCAGNNLEGHIPSCVGQLKELRIVYLDDNKLSGPLPPITLLPYLSSMTVSHNKLTGRLPLSLMAIGPGNNQGLYCDFSSNAFTGSLEDSFSTVNSLLIVNMGDNLLSGPLPASLSTVTSLFHLGLSGNCFSGSIPAAWMNSQIKSLDLSRNKLNGTLPSILGSMALTVLNLRGNLFTGPLLPSLFNTDSESILSHFDCSDNYLTGWLPLLFNGPNIINTLSYLNISYNTISGPIPSTIASLSELIYLDIASNYLSGTLPSSICDASAGNMLNQLFEFIANNNHLGSTIPSCMGDMSLYLLNLGVNHLSGSLDSSLGNMWEINSLLLNSNFFSSSIPNELFSSLSTNYPHNDLSVIDLSDNIFSGSVPSSLFELTSLNALSLSSNCFTGEFPSSICSASSLQVLNLDGLCTNSHCPHRRGLSRNAFFQFIFGQKDKKNNFYFIQFIKNHDIIRCVVNLPNITDIYFSGNGIKAELPDIPLDSNIKILSLSYNRIFGTLPTSYVAAASLHGSVVPILQHMDLSNNRISGTLNSIASLYNYGPADVDDDSAAALLAKTNDVVYLGLHTNRLSGDIPMSLSLMPHIDILKGNVFQCSAAATTLPINDPSYHEYMCASTVLDSSALYILIALLFSLFVLAVMVSRRLFSYLQAFFWLCFDEYTSICFFASALRNAKGTPDAVLVLLNQQQYHCINSGNKLSDRNSSEMLSKSVANATVADQRNESDIAVLSALKLLSFIRFQVSLRRFAMVVAGALFCFLMPCYILLKTYKARNGSGEYKSEDISSVNGMYLYTTHTYQYGWRLTSGAFMQGYTPGIVVLSVGGLVLLGTNLLALWQQHYAKTTNIENFVRAKSAAALSTPMSLSSGIGSGRSNGTNELDKCKSPCPRSSLTPVDSAADMTMVHDWFQDSSSSSGPKNVSSSVRDGEVNGGAGVADRVELPGQGSLNETETAANSNKSKLALESQNNKKKKMSKVAATSRSWPRFIYLVLVVLINAIVLITINMMYVVVSLNEGVSLVTAAAMGLIVFKMSWNLKVIPAALIYQWQLDRLYRLCVARIKHVLHTGCGGSGTGRSCSGKRTGSSVSGHHYYKSLTSTGGQGGHSVSLPPRHDSHLSASLSGGGADNMLSYLVGLNTAPTHGHLDNDGENTEELMFSIGEDMVDEGEPEHEHGQVPEEFEYLFVTNDDDKGEEGKNGGNGNGTEDDDDGSSRLSGGSDLFALRTGSVTMPRVSILPYAPRSTIPRESSNINVRDGSARHGDRSSCFANGSMSGGTGWTKHILNNSGQDYLTDQLTLRGTAVMHSMLLIFNNVLAPILATMLVDGRCFSALVITPKEIDSTYSYPICEQFNITSGFCLEQEVSVSPGVTFTPPFIYSYQCSNSLLIQYVPLFMGLYGTVGIVVPFLQFLGMLFLKYKYAQTRFFDHTNNGADTSSVVVVGVGAEDVFIDATSCIPTSNRVTAFEKTEGDICKPSLGARNIDSGVDTGVGGIREKLLDSTLSVTDTSTATMAPRIFVVELCTLGLISAIHWPMAVLMAQRYISIVPDGVQSGEVDVVSGTNYWDTHTRYKIQSITCNIIASIGVMLTFGLLYPPLVIVIAIYVCSNSLMLQYIISSHCRDFGAITLSQSQLLTQRNAGYSGHDQSKNPADTAVPVDTAPDGGISPDIDLVRHPSNLPLLYQIAKECEGFTGILFYSCTYMTMFSFVYLGLFFLDVTSDMYTFLIPPLVGLFVIAVVVCAKRFFSDRSIAALLHDQFKANTVV